MEGLSDDGAGILRGLAEAQAEARSGRGLPPVERWNPAHCGTLPIRIARDGTWSYMGSPIRRPGLVRLFASILRREPDGSFCLVTPVEKITIEVEDAPFVAVRVDRIGTGAAQRLTFLTNVGDSVTAGAGHAIRVEDRDGEPRPYLHIRRGLEALIARAPFYELVDLAVDRDGELCVTSDGTTFSLGHA